MPEFDPTTVPPFPVVTLDLRDDSSITVNGAPVDIGMDEPPTDAGIAAVAKIARDHGLEAIRVRATSPDGTHLMVVKADGTPYDITPPDTAAADSGKRRRVVVGGAAVLAMVLVAGGVGAVVLTTGSEPAVVAPTAAQPPGYLANLPVLAPPGYGQKAAWSVPVQSRSTPVLLEDGRVVVVDNDGNLAILDGATGSVTWRGNGGPTGQAGIHATTVENRPVLATAGSTALTLWPLDTDDTARVPGTSVDIGASGEVSYLGSAPLVTLSDQTIALLTEDGVKRVDVPVTSTAILATQDTAIAANAKSWWTIPTAGEPVKNDLPGPRGVDYDPTLITAADDTHLITVWPTDDNATDLVNLIDLETNTIVAAAKVPSGTVRDDTAPIHSTTGTTLTLGGIFIDYGEAPQIVAVDEVVPAVIDGDTIYGTQDREPVVARLEGDSFEVTPFTTLSTDDTTVPAAVVADYAYVVAEKVDSTLLYALGREDERDDR
jgi:hypothetical protein